MDKNALIEQKYPDGIWADGLFMVGDTLRGIDFTEYSKSAYAGKVDSEGFYVPPYVKRIEIEDNSFNFWDTVSQWIMTDSIEYFSLDGFYIYGFEHFAIEKQTSGEIIFESRRFVDPDGSGAVDWQERLETLLEKLHANPKRFYANCEKGMYRDRVSKTVKETPVPVIATSAPCVYSRFAKLSLGYNSTLPEKNKKKKILASNGKEYTVTFICKSRGNRTGHKDYDIYDAVRSFDFSKTPPSVPSNMTALEFQAKLPYYKNWDKILARFSEDDLMAAALELAPKNQSGELTKNRVVRLACQCVVSCDSQVEQLITKAKDDKTLEIFHKARPFNVKEMAQIEQDYFATHPELWCEE